MGCLITNKDGIDAYMYPMSGLSECVEKLFHMPPGVKNSLNDDDDAMFKGLKSMFPLDFPNNCYAHVVVMSMPKNGVNISLMIQRTLGISMTI